jgi:hypothetical protein
VLPVLDSDRAGGSYRPLQAAQVGAWEIPTEFAVAGTRTLTVPLQE